VKLVVIIIRQEATIGLKSSPINVHSNLVYRVLQIADANLCVGDTQKGGSTDLSALR
jgi:hypothetical protein